MNWTKFFKKAEVIEREGIRHYWLNKQGINDCENTRCTSCGIYEVEEYCFGNHKKIKKTTFLMRKQLMNLKGIKIFKKRRF